MKDTTVVIVALAVTGAFASALIMPQFAISQSSNAGDYYLNRNSGMSGSMGGVMNGNSMAGMMQMMQGGMGMMGPVMGGPYVSDVKPISIDQALASANRYVSSLNNTDLAIEEIEEYSNNFYVTVQEKSTEIFAFQLLVDRFTGAVYPEPGPNMMWNTKYGSISMMNSNRGMMGAGTNTQMPISNYQAKQIAQTFLESYLPKAEAGDVDAFYGYYNVEVLMGGHTYGMLGVNGFSGQVWYHIWHGAFIQEKEL